MNLHWLGAILIIAGCGGIGFGMALNYKREENTLRQLIRIMDMFCCDLEYRMTPLPELFRKAANASTGQLANLFANVSKELENQIAPDAAYCMASALHRSRELPGKVLFALTDLSRSLGEYDLDGQLQGIKAVQASCNRQLEDLENNRTQRIRSYQTLGLCAGAALAILFL
ncbi:MAG: stage III sporulation protein AB [Oscillospiraceae bacterium]|nr:stage III sporulation protein AB [Oscillospiraceae bacterium]